MDKTIVVQGLPSSVSVPVMTRIASDFGPLTRVVVEYEGNLRGPHATCWLTFQKPTDAARAIDTLDGAMVAGQRVEAAWTGNERDAIRH